MFPTSKMDEPLLSEGDIKYCTVNFYSHIKWELKTRLNWKKQFFIFLLCKNRMRIDNWTKTKEVLLSGDSALTSKQKLLFQWFDFPIDTFLLNKLYKILSDSSKSNWTSSPYRNFSVTYYWINYSARWYPIYTLSPEECRLYKDKVEYICFKLDRLTATLAAHTARPRFIPHIRKLLHSYPSQNDKKLQTTITSYFAPQSSKRKKNRRHKTAKKQRLK